MMFLGYIFYSDNARSPPSYYYLETLMPEESSTYHWQYRCEPLFAGFLGKLRDDKDRDNATNDKDTSADRDGRDDIALPTTRGK